MLPLYRVLENLGIQFHSYADDHQLYVCNHDRSAALKKIKEGISTVKGWFERKKMKLNSDKTEIIVFPSNEKIHIESNKLNTCLSVRNLGFIMDSSLKFSDHIAIVTQKSYFYLKSLCKEKASMDKDTLENFMKSFVLSHLNFCSLFMLAFQTH